MPKLSDVTVAGEIARGNATIAALRCLQIEHGEDWPEGDGRILYHLTVFIGGQLERALAATVTLSIPDLAWVTRNLFELTIISDYLSRSRENRERFIQECALDSLFVIDKFKGIDLKNGDDSQDEVVEASLVRLKQKTAALDSKRHGSRTTREIAKEIGREAIFNELYGVVSKMSHPTPWAILAGTDEPISWEYFAMLLMVKANDYAAECYRRLLAR